MQGVGTAIIPSHGHSPHKQTHAAPVAAKLWAGASPYRLHQSFRPAFVLTHDTHVIQKPETKDGARWQPYKPTSALCVVGVV